METTHDYDFRIIRLFDTVFFWGRTKSTTDILDSNERMLFTLPFVAEEKEVKIALYGWCMREMRTLFP